MIIADTHLIGPISGYWLDMILRDWQMARAYNTAISLHQPDVVFILGDLFDDGEYVDGKYFQGNYLTRFHQTFQTPKHIKVFSAVGNHDIGFHYSLTPYFLRRFETAFTESANTLVTVKDTHFILLNSVTLEQDGCSLCEKAEADIAAISKRLNCAKQQNRNSSDCRTIPDKLPFYSKPVILQHFPTYRKSDDECEEHDSYEVEINKEKWDVLSMNATDFLGEQLDPSVVFCGHTHHYCRSYNKWGIEEYTAASFNRRQKRNPSFLLVEFSGENYAVTKCNMPSRTFAVTIYVICFLVVIVSLYYLKYSKHARRLRMNRSRRSFMYPL
ncbi:hypothetical protein HA402_000444 [Bradysia odoriphaga]|nr:hypothetical protein HA402_000444 [Bradysia odoriphaga]